MTFHRIGVSLALLLSSLLTVAGELPVNKIRLPEGFSIEVLARVLNARQMALGDSNVLYVGSSREGKVHAVLLDSQYHATLTTVVASDLTMPVGVAFRDGNLYVSAVDRILRFDGISSVSAILRRQSRFATIFPRNATMAGSSSPSVPMADSMCRSAPRATSAKRTRSAYADCEHEAGRHRSPDIRPRRSQ